MYKWPTLGVMIKVNGTNVDAVLPRFGQASDGDSLGLITHAMTFWNLWKDTSHGGLMVVPYTSRQRRMDAGLEDYRPPEAMQSTKRPRWGSAQRDEK